MVYDARISDFRFEQPLSKSDVFYKLNLFPGSIDFCKLKKDAENSATTKINNLKTQNITVIDIIYKFITCNFYRRGSIDFINERDIKQKIQKAICNNQPVKFILSFFGYKVLNSLKTFAKKGTEVDISECASLLRFYEIAYAISLVYQPGAIFIIACDGCKYYKAVGFTKDQAFGYYKNVLLLSETLKINNFVQIIQESDFYNFDIEREYPFIIKQGKELYNLDHKFAELANKLRKSLSFTIPIPHEKPSILAKIHGCLSLDKHEEELKEDIYRRTCEAAISYVSVYQYVKEKCDLKQQIDGVIRCTVHPKQDQLGIYPVNKSSDNVFPHHGQGDWSELKGLRSVRVKFSADILRKPNPIGWALDSGVHKFASNTHPFWVEDEENAS